MVITMPMPDRIVRPHCLQGRKKVSALRQLHQLATAVALGAAVAGAQAASGCPQATADELLEAGPAVGTRGFVLAQRLCDVKLVHRPSAPADLPLTVAVTAPAAAPRVAPPPQPAGPRAQRAPAGGQDPAGQARIRALAPLMADVALRHGIDPLLLHALAHIESRHQPHAISPAGARGVMQVMPATGRDMGVAQPAELLTPQANLEASARYLKRLQARFGNDLRLVLAAYNAGEGAVERHGRRVPPFAETQAYVRDVLAVYDVLRRRLAGARA
jgi:soluble lytic murein transglycosylase-like protein